MKATSSNRGDGEGTATDDNNPGRRKDGSETSDEEAKEEEGGGGREEREGEEEDEEVDWTTSPPLRASVHDARREVMPSSPIPSTSNCTSKRM